MQLPTLEQQMLDIIPYRQQSIKLLAAQSPEESGILLVEVDIWMSFRQSILISISHLLTERAARDLENDSQDFLHFHSLEVPRHCQWLERMISQYTHFPSIETPY